MSVRRFLTISPDNEPMWVQLYVYPVGDQWHSVIVADGVTAPGPDAVKGIGFYADAPEKAERLAKAYLGWSDPAN